MRDNPSWVNFTRSVRTVIFNNWNTLVCLFYKNHHHHTVGVLDSFLCINTDNTQDVPSFNIKSILLLLWENFKWICRIWLVFTLSWKFIPVCLHFLEKLDLKIKIKIKASINHFTWGRRKMEKTNLRICSLQIELSSNTHRCFIPEFRTLWITLMSTSVRWQGLDFRAEATTSHSFSESPQPISLQLDKKYSTD